MHPPGFFIRASLILVFTLCFVEAGWAETDLVRHTPRFFDYLPRFFHSPYLDDHLGGQQGLVTFFIRSREALELSDKQVTKLKAVRNEYRKTSAPLRANLQEAEEQLGDFMRLDEMDMKAIEAASRRIEALEHDLRVAFAKAIAKSKRTLTSRQLEKAKELRNRSRYQDDS